MERAGFIGVRRRIPLLVKNTVQRQATAQAVQPLSTGNTSIRVLKDGDIKSTSSSRAANVWDTEALQGYLQSYGQTLKSGSQTETNPQEMETRLAHPRPEDVGVKDVLGFGLLHYAVERDLKGTVSQLLRLRADPNVENCLLRTPLHFAVIQDDPDIVSELLTYGANPNHRDVEGWTPLHFAIHLNHIKCLTVLMGYNPDIHSTNSSGKTPLDYAKDDKIKSLIMNLRTDSIGSQDETADISHENTHTKTTTHISFSLNKTDTSDSQVHQIRSESGSGQELRVQRPNEESGAIAVPHPKSAYS